jgi:hypothetical protein
MIVTTEGFAFSATSANVLLNCRTAEFWANDIDVVSTKKNKICLRMIIPFKIFLLNAQNYKKFQVS